MIITDPKTQTPSRFGKAANIALVVASLLVATAASEIFMRRLYVGKPFSWGYVGEFQNRPSHNFITDEITGWRMAPSHEFVWKTEGIPHIYHSNSQGFRADADFSATDPRKKIALIGDSYTFGAGSDFSQTFGELLQSKTSNRVAFNFAMPGFGIDQVWMSLRHQALDFKPDLVVAGIVDADFERSLIPYRDAEGFNKPTFKLVSGQLVKRTHEQPPGFLMNFLDQHSSLLALARHVPKWVGRRYPMGNYYGLNLAIIQAMLDDCNRNSVPILFVYIPIKEFQPFPSLAAYMHRIGANYIDLTELRPVPPHSIYLQRDGHLSAEGHRFVANLVDSWVRSHMPWS